MSKDSDGFQLLFEKDCSLGDKKFFLSKFPKVDIISIERVHCTSCDCHIGTAPVSKNMFQTHPILGVTQCNKCFMEYKKVKFLKGADEKDFFCTWCGDGGLLLCCSKCSAVFCKDCIKINFTLADWDDFEKDDNWLCFICDKHALKTLRARHWALKNFIKKQEYNVQCQNLSGSQKTEALSKDCFTCCQNKSPKVAKKRSLSGSESMFASKITTKTPLRRRLTSESKPVKIPKITVARGSVKAVQETPETPVSSTLKSPTFIQTSKDKCEEILGVIKICENTVNEMSSLVGPLTAHVSPETSSRLMQLCTSLTYLHQYSAGLVNNLKESKQKM